jgi:hypothetical protein
MRYLTLLFLFNSFLHSSAISHRILPSTKNPPEARKAMAMGFDSVNSRILIYSGSDLATSYYKDMWAFDLKRMEWEELTWNSEPEPTERLHSHIFIDDIGSGAYLLAGRNEKGPILDIWYYLFSEKRVIYIQWFSIYVVGDRPIASIRTALTDFKIGEETFIAAFGGYMVNGNSNTLQM